MRLVQFDRTGRDAGRAVGVVEGDVVRCVTSVDGACHSVLAMFDIAVAEGVSLNAKLLELLQQDGVEESGYDELLAGTWDGEVAQLLPPVDHPDPRGLLVSGTGLTHTGGMQSRDAMHNDSGTESEEPQTDSARMFAMGIAGGKPQDGERGAMPEWFYKGNGTTVRGPGGTIDLPAFGRDGGEEPELAGCYVIDAAGVPRRLGFTLGIEWSDHETEKINYLYLAPSKLRTCAIGPELITDLEFRDVGLECEVTRDGEVLYASGLLKSGEDYMCHSLANCEDHHFKYPQHRVPGDVHVHFFGTSKLSFSTRTWKYRSGDVVTLSAPGVSAALSVTVADAAPEASTPVRVEPA